MLLRVLGPASGVCLALGPVFPEVAHRGPSLIWSGGAPYVLFVCLCVCVCVCVCVCRQHQAGSKLCKVMIFTTPNPLWVIQCHFLLVQLQFFFLPLPISPTITLHTLPPKHCSHPLGHSIRTSGVCTLCVVCEGVMCEGVCV